MGKRWEEKKRREEKRKRDIGAPAFRWEGLLCSMATSPRKGDCDFGLAIAMSRTLSLYAWQLPHPNMLVGSPDSIVERHIKEGSRRRRNIGLAQCRTTMSY